MKALFLDRDGTIIEDTHYLHKPEEVRLLPGVAEALQIALDKEYTLFLFTNQSGVGRGYYTIEDAIACNNEMIQQLNLGTQLFKEICIAPETPEQPQEYRKPSPRFILEMLDKYSLDASKCWMIGDRLSDLEAGFNAQLKAAYVGTGKKMDHPTRQYIAEHSIACFDSLLDFSESLSR